MALHLLCSITLEEVTVAHSRDPSSFADVEAKHEAFSCTFLSNGRLSLHDRGWSSLATLVKG